GGQDSRCAGQVRGDGAASRCLDGSDAHDPPPLQRGVGRVAAVGGRAGFAAALAAVMLACATCGGARQTAVGGGWYGDAELQQGAWPHLYVEPRNSTSRTLVDREI